MSEIIQSAALLFVLLNPFLVIIYLMEMLGKLDRKKFSQILIYAGIIAAAVFCCFAVLGDLIFGKIIQAEFASFQIFGGVIFLIIGLQFVFHGPSTIGFLKSDRGFSAGAIAMPVLIGPGTISASVVIGKRHEQLVAIASILAAVTLSIAIIIVLKILHDVVRSKNEAIIDRYIEITGRISALYVGTVAVEMIMKGLGTWAAKF